MSARLAVAALLWLAAPPQRPADGARTVEGRVARVTDTGLIGVPGLWIVLHRVGTDTAHPLDSMRTRRDGSYRFEYRATGSADAVYFLAARWSGIAYFSAPLASPHVTGADAELQLFDTTSTGLVLREKGRHVIVFAPHADGTREVMEIYELSNDGRRTLVSPGSGRAAWSAALPAAARDARAGRSDVSAAMMIPSSGRLDVFAPFAPGLKQVSFTYHLPARALPLVIPASRDSPVLEVLLEEAGTSATGAGLRPVAAVTLDGHQLARWLTPNAEAGASVTITAAPPALSRMTFAIATLVLVIAAAILAVLLRARRRA